MRLLIPEERRQILIAPADARADQSGHVEMVDDNYKGTGERSEQQMSSHTPTECLCSSKAHC